VDATVQLLGDFRLQVRGRPLEVCQGGKCQRVIRYLMAHARRPVPKDVLIDAFWPDTSVEAGRRNLHQAVYMIRKSLRDHDPEVQLIIHDNDAYAINTELEVWCDNEEFEAEITIARTAERAGEPERALEAYAAAEKRYQGDFLQDSPYEEWALAERARLRLLYTEAANRLADMLLGRGAIDTALQLSQRLIGRDPCDEDAHRRAMRCFAATGRRTLVVRQYRTCVETLARVVGLGPSPETTDLYSSLIAD
jgi:DNA-binding SARP family transcriptional activator